MRPKFSCQAHFFRNARKSSPPVNYRVDVRLIRHNCDPSPWGRRGARFQFSERPTLGGWVEGEVQFTTLDDVLPGDWVNIFEGHNFVGTARILCEL